MTVVPVARAPVFPWHHTRLLGRLRLALAFFFLCPAACLFRFAKKGKGSFNWRMKFKVSLGPRTRAWKFPYLTVQVIRFVPYTFFPVPVCKNFGEMVFFVLTSPSVFGGAVARTCYEKWTLSSCLPPTLKQNVTLQQHHRADCR